MKTTMKNVVSAFALSCLGVLAITGCAAGSASSDAPEGPTSTSEAALVSGGGLSFNCGPLGCICNGDWDCNNMFGSGVCDGKNAKCYERGPGPVYCICGGPFVPARAGAGAAVTPAAGGRVLTASP